MNIINDLFAGVNQFLQFLFSPIIPGTPKSQEAGDPLQQGAIKANAARKGSVVPEIWGTRKIFPDKIVETHSYFESKRSQVSDNFLCVGVGEYDISASDVKIGNTPLGNLGIDASYTLYSPSASVGADTRSECWYNAPEVGATSGGSGIDLSITQPSGSSITADNVQFQVSLFPILYDGIMYLAMDDPADSPVIPSSWGTDTIINIRAPKDATVAENAGYAEFTGNWQDVEPFPGMKVTVSIASRDFSVVVQSFTDNAGVNDVLNFEYDNGDNLDADDVPDGNYRVAIGYRGHNYKIKATPVIDPVSKIGTIAVNRIDDTGTELTTWGGWDGRTIQDFEVISTEAGDAQWIGPFPACPEGETTEKLEFDLFFPQGLVQNDKDDGDIHALTLNVTVEHREVGTSTWTTLNYGYTDSTRDAIGFTETIDFSPAIRPEFRIKRVEPELDTRYKAKSWKCDLLRLKSLLPYRPTSYPDVTTMGVRTRTGDKLAKITENQISVVATRQVNGSDADTISGFIEYIADDIDLKSSQLDTDQLDSLETTYWTPRGEKLNGIFDKQGTVVEALNTALVVGMSSRVDRFGEISAERDGVKSFSGGVTPHHMLSDLEVSMPLDQDDIYNGVDVEYTSLDTWEKETVQCRLAGVTATKIEKLELEGITDRTKAWRIGMRQLRRNVALPYTVTGSTGMEMRNFNIGDRVTVTDDIPVLTGLSAEVYGYSVASGVATITTREKLTDQSFTSARLVVFDHEGNRSGTITPTAINDYSVTFPASLITFTPVTDGSIDRAQIMICESERLGYDIILTEISPRSLEETTFSGVEYSENYFADDDNSPI